MVYKNKNKFFYIKREDSDTRNSIKQEQSPHKPLMWFRKMLGSSTYFPLNQSKKCFFILNNKNKILALIHNCFCDMNMKEKKIFFAPLSETPYILFFPPSSGLKIFFSFISLIYKNLSILELLRLNFFFFFDK